MSLSHQSYYRLRKLGHFFGSPSFKASTSKYSTRSVARHTWNTEGAWHEFPRLNKSQLGSRTLLISQSDAQSKELCGRMQYEMNVLGIQCVQCTMSSMFPLIDNIQESVGLFRRTGAQSIVAIGNGAVSDFAKAVRLLVETGTKNVPETSWKHLPKLKLKAPTPLATIACTLSSVHYTSSFSFMHGEDNCLVQTWSKAPDAVVCDKELVQSSYYNLTSKGASTTAVPLIGSLFDLLFCLSVREYRQLTSGAEMAELSHDDDRRLDLLTSKLRQRAVTLLQNSTVSSSSSSSHGSNNNSSGTFTEEEGYFEGYLSSKDIIGDISIASGGGTADTMQLVSALGIDSVDATSTSPRSITRALESIANVRNAMQWGSGAQQSGGVNNSRRNSERLWGGLLEAATTLCALDLKRNTINSLPYSWVSLSCLKELRSFHASHLATAKLRTIEYGSNTSDDILVAESVAAAMNIVDELFNRYSPNSAFDQDCSESDIHSAVDENIMEAMSCKDGILKKAASKFKPLVSTKTAAGAGEQSLSAQLQNVIVLDEIEAEDDAEQEAAKAGRGGNIHSSSSSSSNIQSDANTSGGTSASRALILNSSVMSDFVKALDGDL